MDSVDTLPGLESAEAPHGEEMLTPCATLLYHPDLRRVGERAFLRGTLSLSRQAPDFAHPFSGGVPEPLHDPHLSRSPVEIRATRTGGLQLSFRAEHRARLADREASGEVTLRPDDLEVGQILELNRRVLLLLHRASPARAHDASGLLGASLAMERVRASIERVAPSEVPVLVTGESGVGKELVARAIHEQSGRTGPFVAVNLGRLSAATAASELFGHARGAFTGAAQAHRGLLLEAAGGSLFLDELGETHAEVQGMLLRALETREVLAVGGSAPTATNFRLITATDADLPEMVERQQLRAALLHRVSGFHLRVEPLRARREDIPRMVFAFLDRTLRELGRQDRLTAEAGQQPWLHRAVMRQLVEYSWPGNVRQLRNVVDQIALTHQDEAHVRWTPALAALLGKAPQVVDREAAPGPDRVLEVLEENGWAFGPAARALGMNRTTFYRLVAERGDVRTGADLRQGEIEAAQAQTGGDLAQMSKLLRVSVRALGRRMLDLGIARGG